MYWFVELRKKRGGRIDKNEDYLSILFAGILQADAEFAKFLLNYLFNNSNYQFINPEIIVQYNSQKYGIPDILIKDNNEKFIIECKLDKPYKRKQLIDYSNIVNGKRERVIFLGRVKPGDKYFTEFEWLEIFYKMKDLSKNSDKTFIYLLNQFESILRNDDFNIIAEPISLEDLEKLVEKNKYSTSKFEPENLPKIQSTIKYYLKFLKEKYRILGYQEEKKIFGQEDWFEISLKNKKESEIRIRLIIGYKDPYNLENLNLMIYIPKIKESLRNVLTKSNRNEFYEMRNRVNWILKDSEGYFKKYSNEDRFFKSDLNRQKEILFNDINKIIFFFS